MARGNKAVEVRVDDATRVLWQEAAAAQQVSLSEWLRQAATRMLSDKLTPVTFRDRTERIRVELGGGYDLGKRDVTPQFKKTAK